MCTQYFRHSDFRDTKSPPVRIFRGEVSQRFWDWTIENCVAFSNEGKIFVETFTMQSLVHWQFSGTLLAACAK